MPTTKKRPAKRRKRRTRTNRPALRDQPTKGRPTRATAFLLFKILLARKEGLSIRYCGGLAGITAATLSDWLKMAERHATGWHGRTLPKPTERAYVEMDHTLAMLARAFEAARVSSQQLQQHIQPDFTGITDFRVTGIGHWLAFLDQWEAVTAMYVSDLAKTIRSSGDWKASAWLLERVAGDDYRTGRGGGAVAAAANLGDDAELSVSLRIAPPTGGVDP